MALVQIEIVREMESSLDVVKTMSAMISVSQQSRQARAGNTWELYSWWWPWAPSLDFQEVCPSLVVLDNGRALFIC
jgi:hypothetical protein